MGVILLMFFIRTLLVTLFQTLCLWIFNNFIVSMSLCAKKVLITCLSLKQSQISKK